MPPFICPEHGCTDIEIVCGHLAVDYASAQPPRHHRVVRFEDDGRDLFRFSKRLCDQCLQDFAIPEDADTMPLAESFDRYPQLDKWDVFCKHCFHHYLERYNDGEL